MRASGSLILTTDGDCRVGPDWVASVVAMYEKTGAKLISGPVTFQREKLLTDYLQTVEFSSLIGSGASSMAMGVASMCNGANLAYQKSIFEEVEGFKGNEHIASGDDEFLMHKIATKYPKDLYFLKSPQAIVQTVAHKNWSGFYGQRKRWASKWKHYNNPLTIALAIYVFSCNASLVILPLLGLLGILSWKLVGVLFILKWVPEWLFIGGVLSFLKKLTSIPFIPLVQILYPFYVTLFGLVAQKPTYLWKDRRLQ
jgi:cellulose synthase/poly-beta-1,6-N-acetylglucosamine synthase-like glycosyltransferase